MHCIDISLCLSHYLSMSVHISIMVPDLLTPLGIAVVTLVHKPCRAFSTLVFRDIFFPSLDQVIKLPAAKIQRFAAFVPKVVEFAAWKNPVPNPRWLLGFLLTQVCDLKAWVLAAGVIWAACPSSMDAKALREKDLGFAWKIRGNLCYLEMRTTASSSE